MPYFCLPTHWQSFSRRISVYKWNVSFVFINQSLTFNFYEAQHNTCTFAFEKNILTGPGCYLMIKGVGWFLLNISMYVNFKTVLSSVKGITTYFYISLWNCDDVMIVMEIEDATHKSQCSKNSFKYAFSPSREKQ
jgi:hypothetical protein